VPYVSKVTRVAAAALAAASLAACSGHGTAVPRPSVSPPMSNADWSQATAYVCAFKAAGWSASRIETALYEAPEPHAEVSAIVTYALAQCRGA
jgi:hypothetical protein